MVFGYADGTPIPPILTASDATAIKVWLRKFKDSVQYD